MALLVSERVGQFFYDDHRLEYTEYGSGDRLVVLLHGALVTRGTHQRLARVIAADGNRVVAVDLLGHGRSDRPDGPACYSMKEYAAQAVALLDHLGVDTAVFGGLSLGANVSLEVAVTAPKRVRGLILEMPGLDGSLPAIVGVFGSIIMLAKAAPPAIHAVRVLTRAVPRGVVPNWTGVLLDACNHRPRPLAAMLQGTLFGRIAPGTRDRSTITVPTLVIGHRFDPVHTLEDARAVAEETDGTFVIATSPFEWRLGPERLDAEALKLVNTAWASRPARRRRSLAR